MEENDEVFSASGELSKLLRFSLTCDKMTSITRRTFLIDKSRRENDAEHSWHIALMALLFSQYADKSVNIDKATKMLLVHDLVELGAGDTFAYDAEANASKAEREKKAADDLYSTLPPKLGQSLRCLWEEFDECKTQDAKYAASMDRLQPFLHNMATGGATWLEGKVKRSQVIERLKVVKEALSGVWPWVERCVEKAISNGWLVDDGGEK